MNVSINFSGYISESLPLRFDASQIIMNTFFHTLHFTINIQPAQQRRDEQRRYSKIPDYFRDVHFHSFLMQSMCLPSILLYCQLQLITVLMNFDQLDELDLGYTPSVATNSRSAGMKKLTRKSQTKPTPVNTSKKQQDFDLLDELLASPAKAPVNKPVQKPKVTQPAANKNKSEVDDFFDEPSLPISTKNTNKFEKPEPAPTIRPSTASHITSRTNDDIILEQNEPKPGSSFKFKRPETAVNVDKKIVVEQPQITISPSTRMMKPPLRKRQSQKKQQLSKTIGGTGLMLPEQPPKSTLTLIDDDSKFKAPSANQNLKRRSSIEANTLSLQLDDGMINQGINNKSTQNFQSSQPKILIEKKEQKPDQSSRKFQLTLQPTKMQSKRSGWEQKSYTIIDPPYQPLKKQEPHQNQFSTFAQPPFITQSQVPYQNIISSSGSLKPQSLSHQQIQKQLQFIKRNYQQHIDSLNKNLQQQIKSNKESRDRLMRQTNSMIQNQRNRFKKVHEEEIQRVKQMGQWEKKKVQENCRSQIQLYKAQIQKYQKIMEVPRQSSKDIGAYRDSDRKQIQYLQEKLRGQRKIIQEKSRILDKRQLDLQQRERQFNKRKRFQQQKIRNEQRRVFQFQMDTKKQIMNEKKLLEDEKQAVAVELATLQMGSYKKTQDINLLKIEIDQQRQQLQRQRSQMRNLNNNLMIQFQKKNEQLKFEKEKVARLQSQLMSKLKIVQSTRQKLNTTNPAISTKKQNSWVNGSITHDKTYDDLKKTMSIDKLNQHKKFETTQNKFMELASNLKQNIKSNKTGSGFDLDNYLMSMAQYTRSKEPVH